MRGGSCRGGPILSASSVAEGPPGFRPSSSAPHPRRAPHPQNSNRESIRLETHVTQRKQRTRLDSNREKSWRFNFDPIRLGGTRVFKHRNAARREAGSPRLRGGHGFRFPTTPAKLTHSSHSRPTQPFKTADNNKSAPLIFVSVRKKSALCFLQLTEILIEPLFRLDSAKLTRPQPSLLGGLADRKEVS